MRLVNLDSNFIVLTIVISICFIFFCVHEVVLGCQLVFVEVDAGGKIPKISKNGKILITKVKILISKQFWSSYC